MANLGLRENSRETITFTCKRGGVAYVITGLTCILRRRSENGTEDSFSTADASSGLTISNGAAGQLEFVPPDGTWQGTRANWQYKVYVDVEVSAGKFISFPESIEDDEVINIGNAYTS